MINVKAKPEKRQITAWRHARAILLLPFMNTVVIPGALLTARPSTLQLRLGAELAAMSTGLLLLGAGAALVAHTIRQFVRSGEGTLAPWDPTRALVTEGAYGLCRNPMKTGLFVILLGEALACRSPVLLGWFACFALVNVIYIRAWEEPGLVRRFGPDYLDYCARVPRWLPRIGRQRLASSEARQ